MSTTKIKTILGSGTNASHRFVPQFKELKQIVDQLKKTGFKIVLTQGVYDLIHEGHARYLEVAREHGDVLVVGVDSDELTRKRKGPDRPIVPQKERINMLLHLRHVDIVTLREVKHGIGDLIKLVKPDVLIVSKSTEDFKGKQIKQYEKYCGKIVVLPPQAVSSTSGRIRTLAIEGAEKLAREINKLSSEFLSKIKG